MIDFWKNLKLIYDYFEKNKKLPKITVNNDGRRFEKRTTFFH